MKEAIMAHQSSSSTHRVLDALELVWSVGLMIDGEGQHAPFAPEHAARVASVGYDDVRACHERDDGGRARL